MSQSLKIEYTIPARTRGECTPPPRLKICLLGRLAPDGAGTLSVSRSRLDPQMQIVLRLAEMGHEVYCILPCDVREDDRPVVLGNTCVYPLSQPRVHSFFRKATVQLTAGFRKTHLAARILREHQCNLIFTREEDITDGLIALYLRARYGVPFVYELVSPLDMGWEIAKIEGRKPRIWWYILTQAAAATRIMVMKRAALTLPTTEHFKESLKKKGLDTEKMLPYPNGVDVAKSAKVAGRSVRERFGLGDCDILIYVGTMDRARRLAVLIEALRRLKTQRDRIKLLMVGDGNDRPALENLVVRAGIAGDVIFTGQVLPAEVPDFIAAADVAISAVPPLPCYIGSSPIKLMEYLAAGKPVIANEEILEQSEVIRASGGGLLVPFAPEAFARAAAELLADKNQAARMGLRGRAWVRENRSFDCLAHRLEERCLNLINSPSPAPPGRR